MKNLYCPKVFDVYVLFFVFLYVCVCDPMKLIDKSNIKVRFYKIFYKIL